MNTYPKKVELVEVGPRDGFQSIKEFIPTELKKEIIDRLVAAGCTTVQVTSFVHPKAIPQMQDAKEVAQYVLEKYPALRAYALVPNLRGAQNAYEAGLREISYVISVSPGHNMANVRRTLEESFAELGTILATYPDMKVVLDAATAFGCPFDGEVTLQQVLAYVEKAHALGIRDIDLCDTIGVATPCRWKTPFWPCAKNSRTSPSACTSTIRATWAWRAAWWLCSAALRASPPLWAGLAAAHSRPARPATRPAKILYICWKKWVWRQAWILKSCCRRRNICAKRCRATIPGTR